MSMQGTQVEFKAGAQIFKEGDPGGDLYFIRKGEVEVYREQHGVQVPLAMLRTGEVLGIMTCLTREPRLASARARTEVEALVVKQAGIKTLIQSTPQWVNTVIKDFILRIKHMDELYLQAMERLAEADLSRSLVRTAIMFVHGLVEFGSIVAREAGSGRLVDVDVAIAHLAKVLDAPPDALDRIMEVFIGVGLVKSDRAQAGRRAELGVLERLAGFGDFARRYMASVDMRRGYSALTPRECAYLLAVVDEAKEKKVILTAETSIGFSRMALESYPMEFVVPVLRKARDLELLRIDANDQESIASFVPQTIGNSVRSLMAIQKLREFDRERGGGAAAAPAPQAAAVAQAITESCF